MNIPIETKPALWGIAAGAVALAIVGFGWGGWLTGGKAESAALIRVNDAVVVALAPVCVDKFQRAGDSAANLAALRKVETWSQATSSRKAVGQRCREPLLGAGVGRGQGVRGAADRR